MCDYSLGEIQNRLAIEGENLVFHRFPTNSIGLASPADLANTCAEEYAESVFGPPISAVPAVCIPPGARLTLDGIPEHLQHRWNVAERESVTFVQTSMEVNRHRDAVRFSNGHETLLQNLPEGLRAQVVCLDAEPAAGQEVEGSAWMESAAVQI